MAKRPWWRDWRLDVIAIAVLGYAFIGFGWVTGRTFEKGGTEIPWSVVLLAWSFALGAAYLTVASELRRKEREAARNEGERRRP